mmetsp:Transcript_101369/g.312664  ORF Transcript_101369/g.312664 Transcript_101369/m.312664 type:complete len:147 (+) Transcript_101369:575-1015(+)
MTGGGEHDRGQALSGEMAGGAHIHAGSACRTGCRAIGGDPAPLPKHGATSVPRRHCEELSREVEVETGRLELNELRSSNKRAWNSVSRDSTSSYSPGETAFMDSSPLEVSVLASGLESAELLCGATLRNQATSCKVCLVHSRTKAQ